MAPPLKVAPEQLKVIAHNMGVVADGIGRVEHTIGGCPPQPEEVLGESGVVAAYRLFHEAWMAELRTAAAAGRQLAEGLGRAASAYETCDEHASRRFN